MGIYNLVRPHFGVGMEGKPPFTKLRELGIAVPEEFALFPPLILDRISADWALQVGGNHLLAHYTDELHLPIEDPTPTGGWQDYLTGILIGLSRRDDLPFGFDGAITGDIPIGAGLSSSASLEVALALGLSRLYKIELGDLDLITLCQRAENEFVGTHCGIMDQYVSLLARENSALLLDIRSLKHRYVPLPLDNLTLLIVDSNVRRSLPKSGYNERRGECQEALRFLQEALPNRWISSLSDLDSEGLNKVRQTMPQTLWERTLHVQEENSRVLKVAKALEEGDTKTVGRLLFSSHASLRDLFCVSTPELDFLVDWARAHGALGARLVGGGFGGVTLHLIAEENSENYAQSIREAYQEEFSRKASVLEVHPGPGAKALSIQATWDDPSACQRRMTPSGSDTKR